MDNGHFSNKKNAKRRRKRDNERLRERNYKTIEKRMLPNSRIWSPESAHCTGPACITITYVWICVCSFLSFLQRTMHRTVRIKNLSAHFDILMRIQMGTLDFVQCCSACPYLNACLVYLSLVLPFFLSCVFLCVCCCCIAQHHIIIHYTYSK